MMSSSYSIEMQYGPCSSLVSRHVMEVSLTLVSYTHFLLVYIDVYVVPPMVMMIGKWQ